MPTLIGRGANLDRASNRIPVQHRHFGLFVGPSGGRHERPADDALLSTTAVPITGPLAAERAAPCPWTRGCGARQPSGGPPSAVDAAVGAGLGRAFRGYNFLIWSENRRAPFSWAA